MLLRSLVVHDHMPSADCKADFRSFRVTWATYCTVERKKSLYSKKMGHPLFCRGTPMLITILACLQKPEVEDLCVERRVYVAPDIRNVLGISTA
jgi:hypothetical protein